MLTQSIKQRIRVPNNLREKDTTTLTWDQLRMALEVLDEGDRILVELDMTDALRPKHTSSCRHTGELDQTL